MASDKADPSNVDQMNIVGVKYEEISEGVHGAVARATGWSAPTQGSNLGCRTFMFRGLPIEFSYKKKYEEIIEERCKKFEAQLKKEQEEATRRLLARYGKTRQGVVEKEQFIMPTFTPPNPSTTTSTSAANNVSFTPNDFIK